VLTNLTLLTGELMKLFMRKSPNILIIHCLLMETQIMLKHFEEEVQMGKLEEELLSGWTLLRTSIIRMMAFPSMDIAPDLEEALVKVLM